MCISFVFLNQISESVALSSQWGVCEHFRVRVRQDSLKCEFSNRLQGRANMYLLCILAVFQLHVSCISSVFVHKICINYVIYLSFLL